MQMSMWRLWSVVLMVTFMTVASWVTLAAGAKKLPRPPAPMPQTGQTQCWDAAGTEIPCDGTGQDGDLQEGIPFPSPRFTDRGNGTVRDNLTGLIWLQKANCFVLPQLWADALQLANTLASGSWGLSDGSVEGAWRLPNVKELESLVDFRFSNPTVSDAQGTGPWAEGNAFSDVRSSKYWSSTSVVNNPSRAWAVNLDGRYAVEDRKGSFGANFVWPVRGPE
jgi:hypothetical protein